MTKRVPGPAQPHMAASPLSHSLHTLHRLTVAASPGRPSRLSNPFPPSPGLGELSPPYRIHHSIMTAHFVSRSPTQKAWVICPLFLQPSMQLATGWAGSGCANNQRLQCGVQPAILQWVRKGSRPGWCTAAASLGQGQLWGEWCPRGRSTHGPPWVTPLKLPHTTLNASREWGAASHDSLLPHGRGPSGWVLHRAGRRHPGAREQTAEASH